MSKKLFSIFLIFTIFACQNEKQQADLVAIQEPRRRIINMQQTIIWVPRRKEEPPDSSCQTWQEDKANPNTADVLAKDRQTRRAARPKEIGR